MKLPFRFTRVGIAAAQFAKQRADWYDYLADIIKDSEGRRTIRDIFAADAVRYGRRSARGVLSAYWAVRIDEGGSLGATMAGTLPAREVGMLEALQSEGQEVFADGLRDLAHLVRLATRLRTILTGTLLAAGMSAALAVFTLLVAFPHFLAPEVMASFPSVDPMLYGPSTSLFVGLSEWLRTNSLFVWLTFIVVTVLFAVSFSRFDGRLRRRLDTWGPYRLYRDIQAIGVISAAATAVQPRSGRTVPLRQALESQKAGASRWLSNRLRAMIEKLDDASAGARIFDVGLLDRETYWYMEDMALSAGLDSALQKTRLRLETAMLARLQSRANVLRWILLLLSVAILLGMALWQYSVIFELRNAVLLSNNL